MSRCDIRASRLGKALQKAVTDLVSKVAATRKTASLGKQDR